MRLFSAGKSGCTDEEEVGVALEIKETNGPESEPAGGCEKQGRESDATTGYGSAHCEGKEGTESDAVGGRQLEGRRRLYLFVIVPTVQKYRAQSPCEDVRMVLLPHDVAVLLIQQARASGFAIFTLAKLQSSILFDKASRT